jgi:hypothetical protein
MWFYNYAIYLIVYIYVLLLFNSFFIFIMHVIEDRLFGFRIRPLDGDGLQLGRVGRNRDERQTIQNHLTGSFEIILPIPVLTSHPTRVFIFFLFFLFFFMLFFCMCFLEKACHDLFTSSPKSTAV